jgi:hypothetical protein
MEMSLRISRKAKLIILSVALALLLLAVLVLNTGFVFFDRYAWITSRRLSAALQGARSVVLVEYTGDVEIARRTATPDEISRLRNATSVWPRPFVPEAYLCWVPHHSIEIVRTDGSEVNAAVCFLCGKFTIYDEPFVARLPPYLAKPLASFFTSVGMAPKTSDEYTDIEISEHRRQSKRTNNQPE